MEEYREGQGSMSQSGIGNSGGDCDVDVVEVDELKPVKRAFQAGDSVRVAWTGENGEPVSVEGRLLCRVPNKPGKWHVIVNGDRGTMRVDESEMEHIDDGKPANPDPEPTVTDDNAGYTEVSYPNGSKSFHFKPGTGRKRFEPHDRVRITGDRGGSFVYGATATICDVETKLTDYAVHVDGDEPGDTWAANDDELEPLIDDPANPSPPQFHTGMRVRVTGHYGGPVEPGATGTLKGRRKTGTWDIALDGLPNHTYVAAPDVIEPLPPAEDPMIDQGCDHACYEPCGECEGEAADEEVDVEITEAEFADLFTESAIHIMGKSVLPPSALQRIAQSATAHLANGATKAQRNEASLRISFTAAVESARVSRLRASRAERDARMLAEAVVNAKWYRGPSAKHRQLAADVLAGKAREPKDEFAVKESPYGD